MKALILVLLLNLILISSAFAQEPRAIPKIADKITLSGDVQFRYEQSLTDSIDAQGKFSTDPVNENFRIRRARIRVDAEVTKKLTMTSRIALQEFNSPAGKVLEYAYFNYKFHNAFQIRAGQFKPPFVAEELLSSNSLPVIDRGITTDLFNANNYAAFQQGLMVHGKIKAVLPMNYYAGVFNGNGRNVRLDENSGKNFVGRLEIFLIPDVRLGGNVQFADLEGDPWGKAWGADLLLDRDSVLGDAIGFYFLGEYLEGNNLNAFDDTHLLNPHLDNFRMRGGYVTILLKWKTGSKLLPLLEIGGKYEVLNPLTHRSNNSITQLTPNIGIVFLPDNAARWQFNVIRTDYEREVVSAQKDHLLFVTQFQVRF